MILQRDLNIPTRVLHPWLVAVDTLSFMVETMKLPRIVRKQAEYATQLQSTPRPQVEPRALDQPKRDADSLVRPE